MPKNYFYPPRVIRQIRLVIIKYVCWWNSFQADFKVIKKSSIASSEILDLAIVMLLAIFSVSWGCLFIKFFVQSGPSVLSLKHIRYINIVLRQKIVYKEANFPLLKWEFTMGNNNKAFAISASASSSSAVDLPGFDESDFFPLILSLSVEEATLYSRHACSWVSLPETTASRANGTARRNVLSVYRPRSYSDSSFIPTISFIGHIYIYILFYKYFNIY